VELFKLYTDGQEKMQDRTNQKKKLANEKHKESLSIKIH
jgi:hypothetical protein